MVENRTVKVKDMSKSDSPDLFCNCSFETNRYIKRDDKYVPNCFSIGLTRKEAEDLHKGLGELLK